MAETSRSVSSTHSPLAVFTLAELHRRRKAIRRKFTQSSCMHHTLDRQPLIQGCRELAGTMPANRRVRDGKISRVCARLFFATLDYSAALLREHHSCCATATGGRR